MSEIRIAINNIESPVRFAFALLLIRLALVLILPLNNLLGFGDLRQLYNLASIPGLPYINHWSEYPPLLPFFIEFIYWLSGGVVTNFAYAFLIILAVFDAANIYIFAKILNRNNSDSGNRYSVWIYFIILAVLPYSWWYLDPIAVTCMLLAVYLLINNSIMLASFSMLIGILFKLFPGFVIVPLIKNIPLRHVIKTLVIVSTVIFVIYLALWLISPEFTQSSIVSQFKKGSWETVWALIDGNLGTGNFGPLIQRLDPASAYNSNRNPAVIPSILTLIAAIALGFYLFLKVKILAPIGMISLLGLTFTIFFLWSPGWSPQWILYLIPLILLSIPGRRGFLYSSLLICINLLEWPLFLSKGYDHLIAFPIILRTIVIVFLAIDFFQTTNPKPNEEISKS